MSSAWCGREFPVVMHRCASCYLEELRVALVFCGLSKCYIDIALARFLGSLARACINVVEMRMGSWRPWSSGRNGAAASTRCSATAELLCMVVVACLM